MTDHLGSVRVIVDAAGVVKERNDYYPFGGRYAVSGGGVDAGSRWKYNGKEDQVTGDLRWLDYGARMYDSELGRWFGVDPKAEEYFFLSTYSFCNSNPICLIDDNGMNYDWFVDADGSIFYDPTLRRGDETRLGDTWSWLGQNGMFGIPDISVLLQNANFVNKWGVRKIDFYDSKANSFLQIPLKTAFFDACNAGSFMDRMGYKYEMTQYVEDEMSYTIYTDKGRGKMADFVYGTQNILVEKGTYLPKNKSVFHYQGLEYLKESKITWSLTTLYKKSTIRYSNPVQINSFWNTFWDVVKFNSKFGAEFDYRNRNVKYKNTRLK